MYKKIAAALVVVAAIGLGIFLYKHFLFAPHTVGYHHVAALEGSYNADREINQALERMKTGSEKAAVITHSTNGVRQIALTFDGLSDRVTIQRLLDLLKAYNVQATFFVDGLQAAEDPDTLVVIGREGQKIGNYSFSGMANMDKLPADRLVKDFCQTQKVVKVTTGQEPALLKLNDTNYTGQLLQAAKACNFNSVVKSDAFLDTKKIDSQQAADLFVSKLRPGAIVSVKLKAGAEPIENEAGKTDLRPAIDKQPGLKELPQLTDSGEKELVAAVEKFLIALKKANYTTTYVENFSPNTKPLSSSLMKQSMPIDEMAANGLLGMASFLQKQLLYLVTSPTAYAAEAENNKAQEIRLISTTEPAVAYTFGGLSNQVSLEHVLEKLNSLGIKATFFVAEVEMKRYPQLVRKIIDAGHEIGLGIRPKEGETLEVTTQTIMRGRKLLQEQFGVETNLIKQLSGPVADITKEAVASQECTLIGQSVTAVQSKHKDYSSADQVMAELFRKGMVSLARGQIVYFKMDYYTNNQLTGDLLEAIKQRKVDNIAFATFYDNPGNNPNNDSQYKIKPVGEILNNAKYIYQYPADMSNVPEYLKNTVNRMHSPYNFLAEVSARYIGDNNVHYDDRMVGFSKMEDRHLDKTGWIHTEDKVIFLTFDDWGSDASINKLLYVLRKHHVPATFFILTHNVLNNPNLLRSIAVQGHNIGGHSNEHLPMVTTDPQTGRMSATQTREAYAKELAEEYQKLLAITGDVTVNGRNMLTRYFRPPQLAISKPGIEALLETGHEYIVSGSSSTNDYKAEGVVQLVHSMEDGLYTEHGEVYKGAVLVMHMVDNAAYTAESLDILLTANDAKADSDPTKFKVGRLSDYLIPGYSQIDRRKSLALHDQIAE